MFSPPRSLLDLWHLLHSERKGWQAAGVRDSDIRHFKPLNKAGNVDIWWISERRKPSKIHIKSFLMQSNKDMGKECILKLDTCKYSNPTPRTVRKTTTRQFSFHLLLTPPKNKTKQRNTCGWQWKHWQPLRLNAEANAGVLGCRFSDGH